MVALSDVRSSNDRIASSLPVGLVAVFVGGTSGIGETSLKQFVKHARQPRVYIVGRSEDAGKRAVAECQSLNKEGEYNFISADVSLIRTVDDVCRDIASKESVINLLFQSQGTLTFGTETPEKLHMASVLAYYSRTRFIINLLPQLQKAPSLRRVVTVFAGTKEGKIDMDDLQAWKVSMLSARGHATSMITLALETLAKTAPEVSFVHAFPGPVKTNLGSDAKGVLITVARVVLTVIGPLVYIPIEEVGQRHLFLATSARYPPSTGGGSGVPLEGKALVGRGTDGNNGSGVYTVGSDGESADVKVERLLASMRKEGIPEKVWSHTKGIFERVTTGNVA